MVPSRTKLNSPSQWRRCIGEASARRHRVLDEGEALAGSGAIDEEPCAYAPQERDGAIDRPDHFRCRAHHRRPPLMPIMSAVHAGGLRLRQSYLDGACKARPRDGYAGWQPGRLPNDRNWRTTPVQPMTAFLRIPSVPGPSPAPAATATDCVGPRAASPVSAIQKWRFPRKVEMTLCVAAGHECARTRSPQEAQRPRARLQCSRILDSRAGASCRLFPWVGLNATASVLIRRLVVVSWP